MYHEVGRRPKQEEIKGTVQPYQEEEHKVKDDEMHGRDDTVDGQQNEVPMQQPEQPTEVRLDRQARQQHANNQESTAAESPVQDAHPVQDEDARRADPTHAGRENKHEPKAGGLRLLPLVPSPLSLKLSPIASPSTLVSSFDEQGAQQPYAWVQVAQVPSSRDESDGSVMGGEMVWSESPDVVDGSDIVSTVSI